MAMFARVYSHQVWCRTNVYTSMCVDEKVHIHYEYSPYKNYHQGVWSVVGKCDGSCDLRNKQPIPAEIELKVIELLKPERG